MPVTTVLPDAAGAPPAASAPPHPGPRRRRTRAPLWLLSPAGLVLAVVTLAPIGFLIFTSFTDYNQRTLFTGKYTSVGADNYTELLADSAFWMSLVRTVLFTAAMVAGSVLIGMGVSHLLTRLGRGMRFTVTVVLIVAWAMPNVASSLVWNWLFQPGYGIVNWFLDQLRVFGDTTDLNWAQDPARAYVSIWLLIVWQAVPFIALTVNAAETQVPQEYKEAARLDGATELAVYRIVTLNHIRPTLLLVTILSVIWDYNVFNQIWLISRGGPGDATATLGVYTFKTAFVGFHLGQGAAISVVTTLLLLGLTAVYIRRLLRSGEDL
ncbi:N,N'-diacetylchitobiose transport system permease protein [Actinoplanes octamycinicus]|uniref:N,N'-diacetylchitobiose transport system permease protein n=1 Tax=Actinoplanes octamycinicus TaxID=135948 RepID=A0A7W7MAN6_9ACTN|nr:sugar ABC transporter permease [Actinoplanes octamycinicus]MBB4743238.1 N,N'-diacetylchitobiose transport system permease protein [Actinoplanes octamycinicus]GIE61198.1 sugar ABC transporter permease [Actinoplanes octamycinicus]